jgi:hypothetical protein
MASSSNRREPLKRSPESQRAWERTTRDRALERQREVAARQERRTRSGLRAGRKKNKVTVPAGARMKALARSHGVCVACLQREGIDLDRITISALELLVRRGVVRAAVQVHHVLDEEKWKQLAKLADNLVGICLQCHQDHHFKPDGRIARAALPSCTLELAEREGLDWYIERTYP